MCSDKVDCFRMEVDLITFSVEIFPQILKIFVVIAVLDQYMCLHIYNMQAYN